MHPRRRSHISALPRRVRYAVRFAVFSLLLPSCAQRQIILDRPPQAYYQTGFPLHDTSDELERVHRSVKRIHFTAEYRTYVFTEASAVTEADDLASAAVLARAVDTLTERDSKGGTATILFHGHQRVALLTNNHVVHEPAVKVEYFDRGPTQRGRRDAPRRVASIALLTAQRGDLADHSGLSRFEVLARDSAEDLALIEVRLRERADSGMFRAIAAPPGDPHQLRWGSFVYVLGYPRGYPMVTFAIVSDPSRDRRGSFLTNGLWNEGISGGVILAVRGDSGGLEWVGLARAGAGKPELQMMPRSDITSEELDLPVLYQGPLFLESILRIQYGITFSVPMTAIREFLSRNRGMLQSRGYSVRAY
jgi:S1-C subfamily serine protease